MHDYSQNVNIHNLGQISHIFVDTNSYTDTLIDKYRRIGMEGLI